jgi:hypothetical protein
MFDFAWGKMEEVIIKADEAHKLADEASKYAELSEAEAEKARKILDIMKLKSKLFKG